MKVTASDFRLIQRSVNYVSSKLSQASFGARSGVYNEQQNMIISFVNTLQLDDLSEVHLNTIEQKILRAYILEMAYPDASWNKEEDTNILILEKEAERLLQLFD